MKKRYAALIFCAIGLLLGSVTSEAKKKPSVTAESAIVMDVQSGAILYEKNIDKREYPASITKVMTALVAIENSAGRKIVNGRQFICHSSYVSE